MSTTWIRGRGLVSSVHGTQVHTRPLSPLSLLLLLLFHSSSSISCARLTDPFLSFFYIPLTACTFLGPSRKRGPPKGYIDAIEARLHQTEALIGIMIAANDVRARGLLDDLAQVSFVTSLKGRVPVPCAYMTHVCMPVCMTICAYICCTMHSHSP